MQLPIDHVAVAVESITAVQPVFESLLGAAGSRVQHIAAQGVNVAFIGEGSARIELLEPTDANGAVARFLKRRGPGLHHLAYRVADIAAELDRLDAAGYELIDRQPRAGADGHRVAFLHPRSTGGVLIELVQHDD